MRRFCKASAIGWLATVTRVLKEKSSSLAWPIPFCVEEVLAT